MSPNNPHTESNFRCLISSQKVIFAARSRPIVTTAWWADFVRAASALCCCCPLPLLATAPCRELDGVHVRGQAEAGDGEQAVERVDGAMVEVIWAPSCSTHLEPTRGRGKIAPQRRHGCRPTSASQRLLADEHRGARVLGWRRTYREGRGRRRRRRGREGRRRRGEPDGRRAGGREPSRSCPSFHLATG